MQTINIQDKRPPFVRFETRAVQDPAESLKAGRPMFKDVPMVIVMQHGSRDEYEKNAEEWLDQKHREAAAGTFPPEWVDAFKHKFSEWKKGNEIPVTGTPLKLWPGATPAEVAGAAAINIHTVEDLAMVPDSGLHMLGLNGRVLRDKAKTYLKASEDSGKVAAEIASLKADKETQAETIKSLQEKIKELEAALPKSRPK